jgi:hypothetical protein
MIKQVVEDCLLLVEAGQGSRNVPVKLRRRVPMMKMLQRMTKRKLQNTQGGNNSQRGAIHLALSLVKNLLKCILRNTHHPVVPESPIGLLAVCPVDFGMPMATKLLKKELPSLLKDPLLLLRVADDASHLRSLGQVAPVIRVIHIQSHCHQMTCCVRVTPRT